MNWVVVIVRQSWRVFFEPQCIWVYMYYCLHGNAEIQVQDPVIVPVLAGSISIESKRKWDICVVLLLCGIQVYFCIIILL